MGMGKSNDWRKFGLTDEVVNVINKIGYGTVEPYGHGMSGIISYLREVDPDFTYSYNQTHFDHGDFSESYEVSRIRAVNDKDARYITLKNDTYEILSEKEMIDRLFHSAQPIYELREISPERRAQILANHHQNLERKKQLQAEMAKMQKELEELN